MTKISDFTDAGRRVAETAFRKRYGILIRVEPADNEIRLTSADLK